MSEIENGKIAIFSFDKGRVLDSKRTGNFYEREVLENAEDKIFDHFLQQHDVPKSQKKIKNNSLITTAKKDMSKEKVSKVPHTEQQENTNQNVVHFNRTGEKQFHYMANKQTKENSKELENSNFDDHINGNEEPFLYESNHLADNGLKNQTVSLNVSEPLENFLGSRVFVFDQEKDDLSQHTQAWQKMPLLADGSLMESGKKYTNDFFQEDNLDVNHFPPQFLMHIPLVEVPVFDVYFANKNDAFNDVVDDEVIFQNHNDPLAEKFTTHQQVLEVSAGSHVFGEDPNFEWQQESFSEVKQESENETKNIKENGNVFTYANSALSASTFIHDDQSHEDFLKQELFRNNANESSMADDVESFKTLSKEEKEIIDQYILNRQKIFSKNNSLEITEHAEKEVGLSRNSFDSISIYAESKIKPFQGGGVSLLPLPFMQEVIRKNILQEQQMPLVGHSDFVQEDFAIKQETGFSPNQYTHVGQQHQVKNSFQEHVQTLQTQISHTYASAEFVSQVKEQFQKFQNGQDKRVTVHMRDGKKNLTMIMQMNNSQGVDLVFRTTDVQWQNILEKNKQAIEQELNAITQGYQKIDIRYVGETI